ncbi:glycogen synthase GlgA [bacterium]|nr:glycogen synthase GlgA [bacterium]
MNKLKILIVSSEAVPFAKTGGLANVAGALPKALKKLGHDVRVILPKYRMVTSDKPLRKVGKSLSISIGDEEEAAVIKMVAHNQVPFYFVCNNRYFDREGLYGTSAGDYPDNDQRFTFFCQATLKMLKEIDFQPDIIHCNDWQTGLIPVYLSTIFKEDQFFKDCGALFTVHNLGYQGNFPASSLKVTGLPRNLFSLNGLEFYGQVSFLKGGLLFSQTINTVSHTYSKEIQTEEFGYGLDGVLRERASDLSGVINGIDYDEWNPAIDTYISQNYTPATLSDKEKNKENLLKEQGLNFKKDVPLIGIVGRLTSQKGFDIFSELIGRLMRHKLQIILLGTGEEIYHRFFTRQALKYPEKFALNLTYDNALAHKIYAGSDFFLMPSLYEPCGLGQLISLKYGTVPIVRKTGGLADTVFEFNQKEGTGNGFLFENYSSEELLAAIKQALKVYGKKHLLKKLILNGMNQDFSWEHSANEYLKLYLKAILKKKGN